MHWEGRWWSWRQGMLPNIQACKVLGQLMSSSEDLGAWFVLNPHYRNLSRNLDYSSSLRRLHPIKASGKTISWIPFFYHWKVLKCHVLSYLPLGWGFHLISCGMLWRKGRSIFPEVRYYFFPLVVVLVLIQVWVPCHKFLGCLEHSSEAMVQIGIELSNLG